MISNFHAKSKVTGFILAGVDLNKSGLFPKGLLKFNGRFFIEHIADKLKVVTSSVMLSANTNDYNYLGLPVYSDVISGMGPLGSIYTALTVSPTEKALLVPCDMPLISTGFLKYLTEQEDDYDVVLPQVGNKLHPLCACYNVRSLNKINHLLKSGNLTLKSLVKSLRCKLIKENPMAFTGNPEYLISA